MLISLHWQVLLVAFKFVFFRCLAKHFVVEQVLTVKVRSNIICHPSNSLLDFRAYPLFFLCLVLLGQDARSLPV